MSVAVGASNRGILLELTAGINESLHATESITER